MPSMASKKQSRSNENIPHKTYEVPFDIDFIEEYVVKMAIEEGIVRLIINMHEMQRVGCEQLLNNTELLQSLRNFDLIVNEAASPCTVLVADLLGIPQVVILPVSPSIPTTPYFQIPLPVSYVPLHLTGLTGKMSFTDRLVNLGVYVFSYLATYALVAIYLSPLKSTYNITPERSCFEALGNFQLLIIEGDFALEYPQPLLPGLHHVLCCSRKILFMVINLTISLW